jgi:hypothetical protein
VTFRTGHMGYTFRFFEAGGADAVEREFGYGRTPPLCRPASGRGANDRYVLGERPEVVAAVAAVLGAHTPAGMAGECLEHPDFMMKAGRATQSLSTCTPTSSAIPFNSS